jgi:hypothetical protein
MASNMYELPQLQALANVRENSCKAESKYKDLHDDNIICKIYTEIVVIEPIIIP